jgi:hypothetical protein
MSETPTPQAVFKGHAQKIVDGGFSHRQGGDGFTTPNQISAIKDLALEFQRLAQTIVNSCPEGAHTTGALRKLQQAQDATTRAIFNHT